MGLLARGSVTDRPWGMTLGALGLRGLTGQLILAGQYKVAFEQGAIVGASSPLANDAAVRLALTGNLITSSQVSEITRRIAASPNRDEVEVLAEQCRLQPEQAQRLRRRLVAQRAARTFSIDQGEFVVEDQITVAVVPGSELDVRAIVFLGARNNLSEDRLSAELSLLGVWFKLKPETIDDLPQFGFSDDERPVLQMLAHGANLVDIEHANSALGARTVRAVAYALAACGGCDASTAAGPRQTVPPQTVLRSAMPATPTPPAAPEKHKTAPLGSRSPVASSHPPVNQAVGGRVPTRNDGVAPGRVPTRNDGVTPGRVPTRNEPAPNDPTRARSPTGNASYAAAGRAPTRNDASTSRSVGSTVPPTRPSSGSGTFPRAASGPPSRQSDPAMGRALTPHEATTGRVPTSTDGAPVSPRTITESSGVPRESDSRNSSGATASSPTGSFKAARDRSPSGGVRGHDRSPSGGVPRAPSQTSRPGSQTSPPATARTRTASTAPHLRPPGEPVARSRTSSQTGRGFSTQAPPLRAKPQRRAKQATGATLEIEALLAKKLPMLEQGVDYFTLFGLSVGASPEDVRSTYFMLARKLHPDRLAAIGIDDEDRQAQRLMACINEAFSVLNDPVRRAQYVAILNRGGEAAVRAEEQKADEMAMRIMRAEEEFRQGEMSMRRDQIAQAVTHFAAAVELQPKEAEYQALLAWAQFAAAPDKSVVAQQTRRSLLRAAEANDESPTARFYLGRVERMLGREKEALNSFYEVLRIKPNHSEATSEVRILEQRLKARR